MNSSIGLNESVYVTAIFLLWILADAISQFVGDIFL